MTSLAFLSNLAGPDMIIIMLIVLILFGAKRLPDLARGMGQAMKEFQKAKDDFTTELHQPNRPAPTAAAAGEPTNVPAVEGSLPPPPSSSATFSTAETDRPV